jgi:hypothetical protein
MTQLFGRLMSRRREFVIDALHVFVLCSFAVAQPLYDLLGRNAEFFVAHRSTPIDLVLFVLVLSFGLPLGFILAEAAAGLLNRGLRKGLHTLVVVILITIFLLPLLKRIETLPSLVVVSLCALLGFAFGVGYIRFHPFRLFLTVLSPAILIFPAFFLLGSPASKILRPLQAIASTVTGGRDRPPIVMVIFDEFSSISLMDENRQIDAARYPNFAALARDAYWFRNATTVIERTEYAVPSILTARYPPDKRKLPTVGDYPNNLFTLLGATYDLNVFETVTTLCPTELCKSERPTSSTERLAAVSRDISVVFLNVVLPRDVGDWLPPVTQGWKGFAKDPMNFAKPGTWQKHLATVAQVGRSQRFREFVNSIQHTQAPSIHFLHILLPHVPLMYLPSGKIYPPIPLRGLSGDNDDKWKNDWWAVLTAHQRYLLQLQFVDRLVGELIAKLKEVRLYENSLLILTSDHGVSFRPNDFRRGLTKENYPEIITVPLFIKLPNQDQGHISDRNAETIDILPSIADVLGIQLPWSADGVSLFGNSFADRSQKTLYLGAGNKKKTEFPAELNEKYDVLEGYIERFGAGTKPYGLFKFGPNSELVGQTVSSSSEIKESDIAVILDQTSQFTNIDLASDYLPANITGHIEVSRKLSAPLDLAITINGVIHAVTKTFEKGVDNASFEAMVPESAFRTGLNTVNVYVIEHDPRGNIKLARLWSKSTEQFRLVLSPGGEPTLVSPTGVSIPVREGVVRGWTEHIRKQPPLLSFVGWAADVRNERPAQRILLFAGSKHFYTASPNRNRPDVAKDYGQSTLRDSGFRISLPLDLFKKFEDKDIRLFALSHDGVATEMKYNDGSRAVLQQALGITMEYALVSDNNGTTWLRRSDGKTIPIQKGLLHSHAERTIIEGNYLVVSGWVVDIQNGTVPRQLLLFANGQLVYSGGTGHRRQDVADALGNNPRFAHSGFRYRLPLKLLGKLNTLDLRIFALSDTGVAGELVYGKRYKHRRTTD